MCYGRIRRFLRLTLGETAEQDFCEVEWFSTDNKKHEETKYVTVRTTIFSHKSVRYFPMEHIDSPIILMKCDFDKTIDECDKHYVTLAVTETWDSYTKAK